MRGKDHVRYYLSGRLGRERRKNIEGIGTELAGSDYQGDAAVYHRLPLKPLSPAGADLRRV